MISGFITSWGRYTAQETLAYLLHSSDEEEGTEPDEQVSEEEDFTEADSNFTEDSEEDSEEREGPETYLSKNGEILWTSTPHTRTQRRARAEEVRRNAPGLTRYAWVRAEDIKSTFELFFPSPMQQKLLEMTNLEGQRVFGEDWSNIECNEIQAFIGLLILAGVLNSHHESASSLWDSELGRAIFRITMPLKKFKQLIRILRFNDKRSRAERREQDKLAPIREMWEDWVKRLPLMYRPDTNITVDESLVGFRGRCPFKQYMPKKPAKYGPSPAKRRRCRKCLPHDLKTGIVCSKCHIPICKGHSIVTTVLISL